MGTILPPSFCPNIHAMKRVYTLLLFSSLLLLHLTTPFSFSDDFFIHLRIASNLAQHLQPYWTLDQPVLASSAPLFTVWLAALLSIFGDSLAVIATAQAIILFLLAWRCGTLVQKLSQNKTVAVFMLGSLAAVATTLPASVLGMETALALLFLVIALELLLAGYSASALFAALMIFLRLELAVFALLLSAFVAGSKSVNRPRWFFLFFLATAVPLLVIHAIYSTLIPNTIIAKSKVYSLSFSDFIQLLNQPHFPATELLLIAAFYCLVRIWQYKSPTRVAVAILTVGATAIITTYAMRGVLLFSWYLPLFSLPLLLVISVAIAYHPRDKLFWLVGLLAAIKSFIGLLLFVFAVLFSPGRHQDLREAARARSLLEIGTVLELCYPGKTVLAPEIGALGVSYRGRIVDAVGLTSPEALKYHPLAVPRQRFAGSDGTVPELLVMDLDPEIIVAVERLLPFKGSKEFIKRYLILKRPIFRANDLVSKTALTLWGSENVIIALHNQLDPTCLVEPSESK